MTLKKSLRENKYVAAQMNNYNPLLEEIVYGFQQPGVLKLVEEITGIREMEPDERARAGLFLAFQYPSEIPGVSIESGLTLMSGLSALERVQASGKPSSALGEGLADALNVGGY